MGNLGTLDALNIGKALGSEHAFAKSTAEGLAFQMFRKCTQHSPLILATSLAFLQISFPAYSVRFTQVLASRKLGRRSSHFPICYVASCLLCSFLKNVCHFSDNKHYVPHTHVPLSTCCHYWIVILARRDKKEDSPLLPNLPIKGPILLRIT